MDFTRFGRQPLLDALWNAGTGVGPPRPQSMPAPDASFLDRAWTAIAAAAKRIAREERLS